jgi:DnaK suppressor protein
MTLLANRPKAPATDNETTDRNGRNTAPEATGHKNSLSTKPSVRESAAKITPPEETLRTLRTRLQAQLDKSGLEDAYADPDVRSMVQSVRRRLNQVNAALERIDEGKYGVCADCHEPIENDRLVLQPMSTRCTRCQTVAEWRGGTY